MCRNPYCRSIRASVEHGRPPDHPAVGAKRSPERCSDSLLQSEPFDEKGAVQLDVLRVVVETKHRIAVHVEEALQAGDRAPHVGLRRHVQPFRKGHEWKASPLVFAEGFQRCADGAVVRGTSAGELSLRGVHLGREQRIPAGCLRRVARGSPP